jgi:hypothetical protein
VEESGIRPYDIPYRLAVFPGSLLEFVLAVVVVVGKVPHIGNVHDVGDGIAEILEGPFKYIVHNILAHMADMRNIVYGRTATVHGYTGGIQGLEGFDGAGEGVVYLHQPYYSKRYG